VKLRATAFTRNPDKSCSSNTCCRRATGVKAKHDYASVGVGGQTHCTVTDTLAVACVDPEDAFTTTE